jgi:hypothetical protein
MIDESLFIEQAARPRLTNTLVMTGLVNRRCHRPRALNMALVLAQPTSYGMTVFFEFLDSYTGDRGRND